MNCILDNMKRENNFLFDGMFLINLKNDVDKYFLV